MPNPSAHLTPPNTLPINCVVLSSFRSEFTFLQNVFRPAIRMHHAESVEQADFLLTVTESTVLLSDALFAGGSWWDALNMLNDYHRTVTMLVIADPEDRPFLGNLYSNGACGVLWKPFDYEEVRRMVRAAHEACWERRILRAEFGISSVGFLGTAPGR